MIKTSLVSLHEDAEDRKRKIQKTDPGQDLLQDCARDPSFKDDVSVKNKSPLKEDAAKEVPIGKVGAAKQRFSVEDPILPLPA